VDFFKPPEVGGQNDRCRCLFVGTHLRDFDVLVEAIKMLRTKNIEFIVVTAKSEQARFTGFDNVTLLNGVDDNHLLRLYQTCDVLALPVTDATANNTLLEAMACGLPVIATDLPAVRDYTDQSCAILCGKGDAQSFADGLIHLCEDGADRSRMSKACRERALSYSWERIAEQVLQLYERVL
jgi:glycosyltransferase involved in cell wall biosynthesis